MNGWLIINKPTGCTSAKVVSIVKRRLGLKKVGHAGTLDPLASGVLPLALNEATKTVDYVMGTQKAYEFVIRWGEERTTDDLEGSIVQKSDKRPTRHEIENILSDFIGDIDQIPPVFSAIKIQGKRACDRARNQENIELTSRKVQIQSLELLKVIDKNTARFSVVCGKGTYVRSLVRDMGRKIGCFACAEEILRTRVGRFNLDMSISLEKFEKIVHNMNPIDVVYSIETVLDDIPAVTLSEQQSQDFVHGRKIPSISIENGLNASVPTILCLSSAGRAVGIGCFDDGHLQPKRVFNDNKL
jgi:tRNA pseudouridine55 synthase